MSSYSEAISSIDSSFIYSCQDETYEGINWQDNRDIPSKAVLDTEIVRLQEEFTANQYQRDRQAEYPSLLELTVALYDTDDKSAVEAKRAAVKLKYPKPE